MKRRDFLRLSGGMLGAVYLSACGKGSHSSNNPDRTPIPNAFGFYTIAGYGDQTPAGEAYLFFPGCVMINDRSEVYFYAHDASETNGMYELTLDFSEYPPSVVNSRTVVREGDILADGKVVDQIHISDVNRHGTFASIIFSDDNLNGVYMEREKRGLEPVAGFRTPAPGLDARFGSSFLDLDLHDDNHILLCAHVSRNNNLDNHQSLFFLKEGEVNDQGIHVLSSGDFMPETEGLVSHIGFSDMHDDGNYVAQIFGHEKYDADDTATMNIVSPNRSSALINGNVFGSRSTILKAISSPLTTTGTTRAVTPMQGDVLYSPRIGSQNRIASVLHRGENELCLIYESQTILMTGDFSPMGNRIFSMSPPVVGNDDLLYYHVYTEGGEELVVYNGAQARTILASGDELGNQTLKHIYFGLTTEQVNSYGQIVLIGHFEDETTAVVVGAPV